MFAKEFSKTIDFALWGMTNQKRAREKNKMTLDKLALMTQNGFIELEDKLNKKIDIVEEKLDGKFNILDGKFNMLAEKIDAVEEKFDGKFHMLAEKIDAVEEKFDGKFDKILTGQDKLVGLLDTQRTEETAHDGLHQGIGDIFADHEKRIKKLETQRA